MRWRAAGAALLLAIAVFATVSRSFAQIPGTGIEPTAEPSRRPLTTPDLEFPVVVPGAVDPDRYVVGPGDVFQLNLSGRLTRTLWLTVGPEGVLFIPGSGAVPLDGLTLTQARREVARKLAGEFRNVSVDLRLSRVRTMRVFLTGEVNLPGSADVPAVHRASEVLKDSVLSGMSSRRNIEVVRRSGEVLIADLERFNRTGSDAYNPPLRDGDVIRVPAAKRFVGIEGAVARTGRVELGPRDSLSTLLEIVGGTLPAAAADRCLLVRWTSSTEVESLFFSLPQVASGEFDPALRDGDHAYIYFQARYQVLEQGSIYGEVARPGAYPLVAGKTRLSELVAAAGGFLPQANLSAIRVIRQSVAATRSDPELERLMRLSRTDMSETEYENMQTRFAARFEDFRLDWERVKAQPELDLLLVGGDVVRVESEIGSVRVAGEVRRPGMVEYAEKRSIDEYVKLAGGYSNRAYAGRLLVTRSVTGQTLRAGDVKTIDPGDMIWVPTRPDRSLWQDFATLITVAAQVATIVLVVRPAR